MLNIDPLVTASDSFPLLASFGLVLLLLVGYALARAVLAELNAAEAEELRFLESQTDS